MEKKVFDKGDMSIVHMECGATFNERCNEMQPCGFPKIKHDYYGKD